MVGNSLKRSKVKSPKVGMIGKKAESFFDHLGGNFMPKEGGNDLFSSINN